MVSDGYYYPGKRQNLETFTTQRVLLEMAWRNAGLNTGSELIVLVGSMQDYYLKDTKKKEFNETVKAYKEYLPRYSLVHPSPLNRRWMAKNPMVWKRSLTLNFKKRVQRVIKGARNENRIISRNQEIYKEHDSVSDLHTIYVRRIRGPLGHQSLCYTADQEEHLLPAPDRQFWSGSIASSNSTNVDAEERVRRLRL